jgi:hypothetical protein
MTGLLSKALGVYRREGLVSLLRKGVPFGYEEFVRPRLPRTERELNGVSTRAGRWFDSVFPWGRHPDPERYEESIVDGLEGHVRDGNSVVIVGGGWGVTATFAAREAGASGTVVVYEGAREYVERTRETVRLNGLDDRVSVREGVVATEVSLKGDDASDIVVDPADLPPCDVLELDCEGAELDVLDSLVVRPRVIIVETHGYLGAPTTDVERALSALSYEVVSRELAEPGALRDICRERDIYVLTAIREGDN